MFKIKRQDKKVDGIDSERYEGVFLPSGVRKTRGKQENIKDFILDNIETVLDEIIDDLDKKK